MFSSILDSARKITETIQFPHLHSTFGEIDFHGDLLSHENIGIFCFGEEFVKNFQLGFGERGSFSALFPWWTLKTKKNDRLFLAKKSAHLITHRALVVKVITNSSL